MVCGKRNPLFLKNLFLLVMLVLFISVFSSFTYAGNYQEIFSTSVGHDSFSWEDAYLTSLYLTQTNSQNYSFNEELSFSDTDILVSNYYILWDQQASLSLPLISLAKRTNSGVFIVSKDNVKELANYLNKKNIERENLGLNKAIFTQVGDFPLSISEELNGLISKIINEESIQKTANKIFSAYISESDDSVLLVSGTVLEEDLFLTEQPIMLVSDSFISNDFISLIEKYSLNSFSAVEESLIPFAEELKKDLLNKGIEDVSFFLKIGQSSFSEEGDSNFAIDNLKTISLPEANIDLRISSVEYNSGSNKLMVYIENKGQSNAYVFASIDLLENSSSEESLIYLDSVGSTKASFIGPEENLVLEFNLSLDVDLVENLESKIFLAYGQSKKQLDKYLISKETGMSPVLKNVEIVDYEIDFIDLDVSQLLYRSDKNAFEIVIKNPEIVELDAVLRVQNILVDGIERDFSSVVSIPSDRSVHLVHADLSSSDQELNKNISLEVQYKKSGEKYVRFLHVVDEFSVFTVIPLIISALLTFLIISFFEFRRWSYRKKEKKTGIRWVKK